MKTSIMIYLYFFILFQNTFLEAFLWHVSMYFYMDDLQKEYYYINKIMVLFERRICLWLWCVKSHNFYFRQFNTSVYIISLSQQLP